MMNLEQPICPLCGSRKKTSAYPSFSPYAVVRCQACKFYYLSPRPTEAQMMQIYSKDSYFEGEEDGYDSYLEQELALKATFRRLMSNLAKRELTGGSLLEIGCGYGYLLEAAQGFFSTRIGTDFSAQAVQKAKNRADEVYQGGIEQISLEKEFDLVIATHVIEHVYQPKLFLEQLCQHLRSGGKVVIATPNMGSFWRYLMGHRWPSFKMPEHILYFDEKALSSLMRQVGITNIQYLPYPHAFPLPLVASKFGIKLPPALNQYNLWLPATTLALYGTYYK